MYKPIKILVLGNKDTERNKLIDNMKSLGNPIDDLTFQIYKVNFQFLENNISDKEINWKEIIENQNIDIILFTFDYRYQESFIDIQTFIKKKIVLFQNIFYRLIGIYFDVENKKVSEGAAKTFANQNKINLYNIIFNQSNVEKKFKSLISDYGKTKELSHLIFEKGKQNLEANIEDGVYICKIVLIGSKSGKSTLINTYKTQNFNPNIEETQLMDNYSKIITYTPDEDFKFSKENINSIKVKVDLWDTPHLGFNEENLNYSIMISRNADVIIYLYDSNNMKTFYEIQNFWDKKIHDNIDKNAIFYIIENRTENKDDAEYINYNIRERMAFDIGATDSESVNASKFENVNNVINKIITLYLSKIGVIEKKTEKEKMKQEEEKEKEINEKKSNETSTPERKRFCLFF